MVREWFSRYDWISTAVTKVAGEFDHLTTEIAKSGIGGLDFLYGVFGLYTLKKCAYGDPSAGGDGGLAFRGTPWPWGMKRSARKMDPVGVVRTVQSCGMSD